MKILIAATFALMSCGVALAQGPVPGGHPGFPPPGGMHGPRPISVTNLPLRTLSTYLGITDAQKGKIAQIREDVRGGMRPPVPGEDGPRGDRHTKIAAAEQKASTQIKAILTPQQNVKLATLVKAAQGLVYAQIQPEGLTKLQLTPAQLARLATLNAKNAPSAVNTILTNAQKAAAKSYQMPSPPRRGIAGEMPPPAPERYIAPHPPFVMNAS